MGAAAYRRGSRAISAQIDREQAARRTRTICGGTYRPGPNKDYSRCDRCGRVDYEKYEGDKCTMPPRSMSRNGMQVVQDDLWFCQDCMIAAVNDDYTGLDFSYGEEEATRRMHKIQKCLAEYGPHLVPDFDSETGEGIEEFSHRACDCCGDHLAGGRHRFAVLGPMQPNQRAPYVVTVRHASGAEDPSFSTGEPGDSPIDVAHRAAQVLHGNAFIRVYSREPKSGGQTQMFRYSATSRTVTPLGNQRRFPDHEPNASGENAAWSIGDMVKVLSHDPYFNGQVGTITEMHTRHGGTIRYTVTLKRGNREIYVSDGSLRAYSENRHHPNSSSGEATILNPSDAPASRHDSTELTRLWFGAYGSTKLYYWGNLEDGFEAAVEWADDHAPGLLSTVDLADYQAAAEEEGIKWKKHWPDFEDEQFQRVVEAAEADMTMIGHTTLTHGNAVPSFEWGGDTVPHGSAEYNAVLRRSQEEEEHESNRHRSNGSVDVEEGTFRTDSPELSKGAREHLRSWKGSKAPHGFKWSQRVTYQGKSYLLYDHDAEGSGSLAFLVTPDLSRYVRYVPWTEIS